MFCMATSDKIPSEEKNTKISEFGWVYTGCPRKNGTVDYQYIASLKW